MKTSFAGAVKHARIVSLYKRERERIEKKILKVKANLHSELKMPMQSLLLLQQTAAASPAPQGFHFSFFVIPTALTMWAGAQDFYFLCDL